MAQLPVTVGEKTRLAPKPLVSFRKPGACKGCNGHGCTGRCVTGNQPKRPAR